MKYKEIPMNLDFEIINIQPINDYISDCEIKVFYTGKNRNGSYISKAVGNLIANSLPRTPIVAFYNEQIGDYEDHGEEIIINSNGIKFIKKTVPYGAVSENAPIVWKKFLDSDGTEREYMVCKGFLWTGRYPHLENVLEFSKGQSMEFFPESVVGDWAKFDNDNEEFFIFNEANISALCILGDHVEPCFEGASVNKPEILYSLKKNEFKDEFNRFMLELNEALDHNLEEGGNIEVENELINETVEEVVETVEEVIVDVVEEITEIVTDELTTEVEEVIVTEEVVTEPSVEEVEVVVEETVEEFTVEQEVETTPSDLEVLQDKFTVLENNYNLLKEQYDVLFNEKNKKENEAKEVVCERFSVLGEDVLKEIKENLANYSLEDLEDKLSAIAFKKGISFNLITDNAIITPNPQQKNVGNAPAWVQAVDEKVNKK